MQRQPFNSPRPRRVCVPPRIRIPEYAPQLRPRAAAAPRREPTLTPDPVTEPERCPHPPQRIPSVRPQQHSSRRSTIHFKNRLGFRVVTLSACCIEREIDESFLTHDNVEGDPYFSFDTFAPREEGSMDFPIFIWNPKTCGPACRQTCAICRKGLGALGFSNDPTETMETKRAAMHAYVNGKILSTWREELITTLLNVWTISTPHIPGEYEVDGYFFAPVTRHIPPGPPMESFWCTNTLSASYDRIATKVVLQNHLANDQMRTALRRRGNKYDLVMSKIKELLSLCTFTPLAHSVNEAGHTVNFDYEFFENLVTFLRLTNLQLYNTSAYQEYLIPLNDFRSKLDNQSRELDNFRLHYANQLILTRLQIAIMTVYMGWYLRGTHIPNQRLTFNQCSPIIAFPILSRIAKKAVMSIPSPSDMATLPRELPLPVRAPLPTRTTTTATQTEQTPQRLYDHFNAESFTFFRSPEY